MHRSFLLSALLYLMTSLSYAQHVGIGIANPLTLLSNTDSNILALSGEGVGPHSITWRTREPGFVMGL